MSSKLMGRVWELDVKHPVQAILLVLANEADDQGRGIELSAPWVAWKTDFSERQVRRVFKEMRERSVLRLIRASVHHSANEYVLELNRLPEKLPFGQKRPDSQSPLNEISPDSVSSLVIHSPDSQSGLRDDSQSPLIESDLTADALRPDSGRTLGGAPSSSLFKDLREDEEGGMGGKSPAIEKNSKWLPDDLWLKEFIDGQTLLAVLPAYLDNPKWWEMVGVTCGGLDKKFLEVEFAKMQAHLIEKPEKAPSSSRGWKRFIRGWLYRQNRWEKEHDGGEKRVTQ